VFNLNIVGDIIYNVAIFFMMMIPGIILKKAKMVDGGIGKGLSNLVLFIAQPALIFVSYLRDFSLEILINALNVLALSFIVHIIFTVIARIIYKTAPDKMRRMLEFATIFSNAAFMGIPLISAVLESSYPGATLYASIYNITFNIFLWSVGVRICTEGKDIDDNGVSDHIDEKWVKKGVLKALRHPVSIAAYLGLIVFCFSLHRYIPVIITDSLNRLQGLVAPLSMVVLGLRFVDVDFKRVLKDKFMYIFLVARHLALPVLVVFLIKLLMLIGLPISEVITKSVVIMVSAPAATSATMFAEKYDCDSAYVSGLVAVSTLVSIVTMPLVMLLV
jgi:predicted permease